MVSGLSIHTDYAIACYFLKISENYAKTYASTIYKSLLAWLVLLGDIVFRPESCNPICRYLLTCPFREIHL